MYNRQEIMRNAHNYRKVNNLNKSDSLRAAWLNAKIARLDVAINNLSYADRFTAAERKLNDEFRYERNFLARTFATLIPPIMSDRDILLNKKEEMMRDAWLNSDNATYYKIRKMNVSDFADYIKTVKAA